MTGESKNPWLAARRGIDLISHPRWVYDVGINGKPHIFGNLEEMVPGARTPMAFRRWVDAQFDPSVTWDDLAWVRAHWDGPIVLKGILDPEDARAAADAGVEAVVVSNHGGRQLDAVPSTAAALPAVAEAVGDRVEVLVDGGVRSGLDVLKMMSLGARACLVGRPWAWAVAADGEAGVTHLLQILRDELAVAMGLTGTDDVANLGADHLL
jgi:L-lactate dehydrogenase (cytochrome)